MTTILAVIPDLMFQSRLREHANALGHDIDVADTQESALAALAANPADLLVIDLHAYNIETGPVIAAAKEAELPVLAFGRHTEADILREAREAGCDRVVVRSTFVEELPQLLRELAGSKGTTDPR